MRFDGKQRHPQFNLDGGQPAGIKTIIRAARDPIKEPQEPAIYELLERTLCRAKLGEDCYEITSVIGEKKQLPYSATHETWVKTCNDLLTASLANNHGT